MRLYFKNKTKLPKSVRRLYFKNKTKLPKSVRPGGNPCSPCSSGGGGRRIALAWEVEAAVSYDGAAVLQPISKNKNKTKKETNKSLKESQAMEVQDEQVWAEGPAAEWAVVGPLSSPSCFLSLGPQDSTHPPTGQCW